MSKSEIKKEKKKYDCALVIFCSLCSLLEKAVNFLQAENKPAVVWSGSGTCSENTGVSPSLATCLGDYFEIEAIKEVTVNFEGKFLGEGKAKRILEESSFLA